MGELYEMSDSKSSPKVTIRRHATAATEDLINEELDTRILSEPDKLPRAVYYIVPNELAERFCFYGIRPLLRSFFMSSLGYTNEVAMQLYHVFNTVCYFFPLFGAAISDSWLDKYHTIVYLSLIYAAGTITLSVTSIPNVLGLPPAIPVWGPLLGLALIGIGTGGIKPCVSAHGGDQFLPTQKNGLEKFYSYFYMAINIGAVGSGFLIPWVQSLNFYGNEGDGYPVAFGICSAVMGIATILFILGKSSYRIVPPAGVFLPWELAKTGAFYTGQLMRSKGDKAAAQKETARKYGRELLIEYFDLVQVLLVLLPSTFFWMAFDQSGSSWQGLTDQMNPDKFLSSIMVNTVVNPIFIVILSPVFSTWVYPCIDTAFPKKFGLLTRMVAGMILTGISFLICAVYQGHIDKNCTLTEFESNGLKQIVCYDSSFSTAWFVIPYFVITAGEVLFSISGLNFAYTEVGKRMKSSTAALWLLTVAFGNLLDTVLFASTADWDRTTYFYLVAGLCFAAAVFQVVVNQFYVYKADRHDYSELIQ